MRHNRIEPQGGAMGVSVGSASIVMIFAVVSLTLLAVMTLMTAHRELQTAKRAAQAVTDYYAADALAAEIYDEVRTGQTGTASAQALLLERDADSASFTVAIDEGQLLAVALRRGADGWHVTQWQVQRPGQEQIEDLPDLWDGSEAGLEIWAGSAQ